MPLSFCGEFGSGAFEDVAFLLQCLIVFPGLGRDAMIVM